MKLLILAIFVVLVAMVTAAPGPYPQEIQGMPFARLPRASPQPKMPAKEDMEGSESAYIAYPYVYPYWGYSPYVWVG